MEHSTKVLRSKSSNAAVPKVIKKAGGKKSRSSGEFNAPVSKKRGVYVEKTSSNLSPLRGNPNKRETTEPPPRPPPGKKIFLKSVLKILSKSSAATQCQLNSEDERTMCKSSEGIEDEIHKKINQAVERQNRIQEVVRRCSPNKIKGKCSPAAEVNLNSKTKKQYRSRVLNEKLYGNSEFKKDVVTVLSTKKDFMQTPSICSGRSRDHFNSVRWSEMYIEERKEKSKRNTEDLIKEIIEGKTKRMTKDQQIVRPKTQIEVEEKKDEKGLYKFFVDLFKTTISVNNFKMYESDDNNMFSGNETKNNLQINESVATKLNIKPVSEMESNVITDFENSSSVSEKHMESHKIVLQSKFKEPERKQKKLPQNRSVRRNLMQKNPSQIINQNISAHKNNKRKILINMFKRELTMDYDSFEEPQNLYQALKVMARNKKHYKSYSDEMSRFQTRGDKPCMYRGRKVLALDKKSAKRYRPRSKIFKMTKQTLTATDSEASDFRKQKGRVSFDEDSNHSLEVYNEFDDLISSH